MDKRKTRKFLGREKKRSTRKTIDRLVYCPGRDKGKCITGLRKKLQNRVLPTPSQPPVATTLKVGAININGLSSDSGWAAEQLIKQYGLKVLCLLIRVLYH